MVLPEANSSLLDEGRLTTGVWLRICSLPSSSCAHTIWYCCPVLSSVTTSSPSGTLISLPVSSSSFSKAVPPARAASISAWSRDEVWIVGMERQRHHAHYNSPALQPTTTAHDSPQSHSCKMYLFGNVEKDFLEAGERHLQVVDAQRLDVVLQILEDACQLTLTLGRNPAYRSLIGLS